MNPGIVNTLKLNDPAYPDILRHIPSAPKQLFWVGADFNNWLDKPRVAIVGSRKVSPYGQSVTKTLSRQLAECGVVIISGLAYGVDTLAHNSALEAGGVTIAILAGGLDFIYPTSNLNLSRQIVQSNGTLISEYSNGTVSFKQNFIARNRIVSGLADILIITEASLKSGTLHTAKFALEQGKTVMAVPGNITSPNSEGTNNLIKSGALPLTDISDVLFALQISNASPIKKPPFRGNQNEADVLRLISNGMHAQEDLALASKLESSEFSSVLTILEISGYIRPIGGGNWVEA